jgi:hypothetical protein
MAGGGGDWLIIQELFARGDPAFVDELRKFFDADVLAAFAPRWFEDQRPEARQLLFDYLDRPLNAFRHEALVKRLFKRAEAAGDDALMARFLVAFDRSIRRVRRKRYEARSQVTPTESQANAFAGQWRAAGFDRVSVTKGWQGFYYVYARRTAFVARMPRDSTMPRGALKLAYDFNAWDREARRYKQFWVPDWVFSLRLDPLRFRAGGELPRDRLKDLEKLRLFSIPTRHYLRRRSWRYFRKLGRNRAERYVPAVVQALVQYRDDDVGDAVALLDNFGLVQILFRFSPCLVFGSRGCGVAPGRTLAELEPAPRYARLWDAAPRALVDLLIRARSRPVRSWAVRMIRRNPAAVSGVFPLDERLALLASDDADVVALAAELLRGDPALHAVAPARWLELIESASPTALEILCELAERQLRPEDVTLAQAVRLAMLRPVPVARLGLRWLTTKEPGSEEECGELLALGEAESDAVRADIIRWVAGALSRSPWFRPDWVLEWLDSRHDDVRAEGLAWFRAEPRARDDVAIWQRLMENPHDDVRLALIAELEARTSGERSAIAHARDRLDPELLRLLWASVLLNVRRGGRMKPVVIRQLRERVESRPDELARLLPLLAVALRSVRGPELRSGLAALVRIAEHDAHTVPLIQAAFPELQLV